MLDIIGRLTVIDFILVILFPLYLYYIAFSIAYGVGEAINLTRKQFIEYLDFQESARKFEEMKKEGENSECSLK